MERLTKLVLDPEYGFSEGRLGETHASQSLIGDFPASWLFLRVKSNYPDIPSRFNASSSSTPYPCKSATFEFATRG